MLTSRCGGIVVCGGESRRMGRPKAWLPLRDETLLGRVVRIMGEVVEPIVVVAAAGQTLPPLPTEVRIARDEQPGLGPLEGLRVGLRALEQDVDAAFVTTCDAPGLRPDFIRSLLSRLQTWDAAVPQDDRFVHCLAAVYRTSIVAAVEQLLREGERRPRMLLEQVNALRVPVDELKQADPELLSLQNVNTPEEYTDLVSRLEQGEW